MVFVDSDPMQMRHPVQSIFLPPFSFMLSLVIALLTADPWRAFLHQVAAEARRENCADVRKSNMGLRCFKFNDRLRKKFQSKIRQFLKIGSPGGNVCARPSNRFFRPADSSSCGSHDAEVSQAKGFGHGARHFLRFGPAGTVSGR
jgi:hypothetical protein